MRFVTARHLLQKIIFGGVCAAGSLVRSRKTLTGDGKDRHSTQPRTCVVAPLERLARAAAKGGGDPGTVPQVGMSTLFPNGIGVVMPSRKSASSKGNRETSELVVTVEEIRRLLVIGRAAAYALARQLGRRIGGKKRGRLLVPRAALEKWLGTKSEGGAA